MQVFLPVNNNLALLDVALTIVFIVGQVLRAGEGLQTVEDAELSKLVQDEQYVLALFCKSASGLPCASVADPDPYVFGPPGSGSVSQDVQIWIQILLLSSKNSEKTLIPTIFL
jgi:hypothetical protein